MEEPERHYYTNDASAEMVRWYLLSHGLISTKVLYYFYGDEGEHYIVYLDENGEEQTHRFTMDHMNS